jgi:hypothetical protein
LLLLQLAAVKQRNSSMLQLPAMRHPAAFLQAAGPSCQLRLLPQLCCVFCLVDLCRKPLHVLCIVILQANVQRVRLPMLILAAAAAAAAAAS